MYNSPIEAIFDDIKTNIEGYVVNSVQRVGICVDKNELVKALEYDRGQYEKGYRDGLSDATKHGKWIEYPIVDGMNQCSVCGVLRFGDSNYCPNCGADMRGEQKEETDDTKG